MIGLTLPLREFLRPHPRLKVRQVLDPPRIPENLEVGLVEDCPKKGGAGGKGTWGKLGCELELPWIDPNDPNYESDSEKADSPKDINGKSSNINLKPLVPELSEEDVRKAVEPLILEYFENSDSTEVLFTLQEMLPNLGARRWMVVTITVELAMDHKPSHRELASVLISDLYQKVISQRDIGKGETPEHVLY